MSQAHTAIDDIMAMHDGEEGEEGGDRLLGGGGSNNNKGAYAWEKGFDRTWEDLREDEYGNLQVDSEQQQLLSRARRGRALEGRAIKRGMIRYLYLAIDLSKAMGETDIRPNRLAATLKVVSSFVEAYFDQNPLSQLGIIVTSEGIAEVVTELSGNPKAHIEALKKVMSSKGNASLQNLLDLAVASLEAAPEYGNRELVIVYASLSTCDPGDVNASIAKVKASHIRASVVGLGAELFVCKKLAEETRGDYIVALDERHFRDSVMAHITPPPRLITGQVDAFADLMQMGFPKRQDLYPSLGYSGTQQTLTPTGYHCPRCKTKTTDLPSTCNICSLQLASSPHLARSYHHLFPVPVFAEVSLTGAAAGQGGGGVKGEEGQEEGDGGARKSCSGCLKMLATGARFRCPRCAEVFCLACDMYIHDSLHNCPGCC